MDMQTYVVKAEGWLDDGLGIGAYRQVDDEVLLLPVQAEYIIATGQIAKKPVAAPPPRARREAREPASE